MVIFWDYLGWSIVALTALAYVWLFFRYTLYPKRDRRPEKEAPRIAA